MLPSEYRCPLAVWQLGDDLTLVALSGEVVSDFVGLLEDALGQGRLWVAAYCHDVYGYLPSRASSRRVAMKPAAYTPAASACSRPQRKGSW